MREAFKQKIVGFTIAIGAIMIVCGFAGAWVFSVAGVFRGTYTREPGTNRILDAGPMNWVPLAWTCSAIGVVVALGGLGYGWYTIATERTGLKKTIENVKVLARYAYNRSGDMLNEWYQIEEANGDVRFYVRLMLPNRECLEFECSEQVYHACGEGMFGQASVQNKWLGQFVGYVGGAPDPNVPNFKP